MKFPCGRLLLTQDLRHEMFKLSNFNKNWHTMKMQMTFRNTVCNLDYS